MTCFDEMNVGAIFQYLFSPSNINHKEKRNKLLKWISGQLPGRMADI